MKAMRAFRGVSAALLKQFLSTGLKTFEQIEQYLDTACLHPTGRHWVNNFLLPTLIVHQFERAEREGNIYLKQVTLEVSPTAPDTIVVDVSQLFYHTVWPHGGNLSDLIASIKGRINRYPDVAEKIIVFDKYKVISAKDHERLRRAGEVVIDYELSITSPLLKRDAILKSKSNKRRLASVLCTFSLGDTVTMETQDDGAFSHDEADVTMISYVLQAANCGKSVIRVLSDDTDVFVLLVYWVHRASLQCKVQME